MRLNTMEQLTWNPLRWNPVIPSPRHMECRIEMEYAIGERIAPAEIIEEPAVDPGITQGLLNLADTLLHGCGHNRRHLIVALPGSQCDRHSGRWSCYTAPYGDRACTRTFSIPRDPVCWTAAGEWKTLHLFLCIQCQETKLEGWDPGRRHSFSGSG